MTYFGLVLVAFLISLFIGTKSVCIGLGVVVAVGALSIMLDNNGWLK